MQCYTGSRWESDQLYDEGIKGYGKREAAKSKSMDRHTVNGFWAVLRNEMIKGILGGQGKWSERLTELVVHH